MPPSAVLLFVVPPRAFYIAPMDHVVAEDPLENLPEIQCRFLLPIVGKRRPRHESAYSVYGEHPSIFSKTVPNQVQHTLPAYLYFSFRRCKSSRRDGLHIFDCKAAPNRQSVLQATYYVLYFPYAPPIRHRSVVPIDGNQYSRNHIVAQGRIPLITAKPRYVTASQN